MSGLHWEVSGGHIARSASEKPYTFLYADLMRDGHRLRQVQLSASSTGRALHIYVDGVRYEAVES